MAIDAAATGQPAAKQPLLYKRLEPIEPARHRGLKLDRMGRNYRFVANESVIPLAMSEFVAAGVFYPIVFSDGPDPMPLAVLGYRPGENLHVDAEGRWTPGVYVPWYVRCYPFAVLNGPQDSFVPCVDVEGAGIGPLLGDLLLENDQPTAMLQEIVRFCHGYNRALKDTRELGRLLHSSGLLEPHQATIALGGERKPARLTGFHAVEAKKFEAVPDKTFLAWRKKGLLTAIYQHLHSLSCWPILSAAASARLDKAEAA